MTQGLEPEQTGLVLRNDPATNPAWNTNQLEALRPLLEARDRNQVLDTLRAQGYDVDTLFRGQGLSEIQSRIRWMIREIEKNGPITVFSGEFNTQLNSVYEMKEGAASINEKDVVSDDPRLDDLKKDFDRGLLVLKERVFPPFPPFEFDVEDYVRTNAPFRRIPYTDAMAMLEKKRAEYEVEKSTYDLKNESTPPEKSNLTWEEVVERLNQPNSKNPEKTNLELVLAMQGGGELLGEDKEGRLLFKDRGRVPQFCRGMDYWETYEKVYGSKEKPSGYELFPNGDRIFNKPTEISIFEKVRNHLIEGIGMENASTWLDNGRDSERSLTVVRTLEATKPILKDGKSGYFTSIGTQIMPNRPSEKKSSRGAIRLLRI